MKGAKHSNSNLNMVHTIGASPGKQGIRFGQSNHRSQDEFENSKNCEDNYNYTGASLNFMQSKRNSEAQKIQKTLNAKQASELLGEMNGKGITRETLNRSTVINSKTDFNSHLESKMLIDEELLRAKSPDITFTK